MSSPQTPVQNITSDLISARMDRIPRLTRSHFRALSILIALFIFDLIDIGTLATVAPAVRAQWGLSIEALGLLTSTTFVGMAFGAMVGGRVADRVGRRPTLITAVFIFSAGSLLSALATGPEFLGIARMITGVGIGATSGGIFVMVSEMFPKPLRGRMMAMTYGIAGLSGPAMSFLALLVMPTGNWHVIFLVGSGGFVFALLALRFLPESPRWLASRGRGDRADAQMRMFEAEYESRYGALPEPVVMEAQPATRGAFSDLFRRSVVGRTVVASFLFLMATVLNYGLIAWFPVVLIERGYPTQEAYSFLFVMSFATVLGALLSSTIIDRFERKWVIMIAAVVLAVCYLVIGFVDSVPVLLTVGFAASFIHNGITTTVFAYMPEIFPVAIRGQGTGFANGIGRLGGIVNSLLIGVIIAAFATEGLFVYLAAICVAMSIGAVFGPRMGIREARRTLLRERAAEPAAVPVPAAPPVGTA